VPTETGLNAFLGFHGTHRIHELTRQAARITAEMNNPAVSSDVDPSPVSIIRRVLTSAGNPSQGIEPTYNFAAGLSAVFGTVILPAAWNPVQPQEGGVILKDNERVVILVDIPAAGGVAAGKLLLSDQLLLTDPIYGFVTFDVTKVMPSPGPNIVRAVARYAREEA
jgi:hypothetical protein